MEYINYEGLIIGLCTFLIIGLFHPLVIKGEYRFGQRCRLWFGLAGVVFLVLSLVADGVMASSLLGVTSFSCFWSILEVAEQKRRVEKGWFPMNPRRASEYSSRESRSAQSEKDFC